MFERGFVDVVTAIEGERKAKYLVCRAGTHLEARRFVLGECLDHFFP